MKTAEQCAASIKETVGRIEITENASVMTASDKMNQLQMLYFALDLTLTDFCEKVDKERREAKTQREESYINSLFVKTLDLVDVERMPARRQIAA